MLVTFRSTATDSITLFSDVAQSLLKMMGATGKIPGALNPEDVPAALERLERATNALRQQAAAPPAVNEDRSAADAEADEDEEHEPPIDLATRAVPLISLLKRAAAANAEVMWEGK
jgi:hypothetical protein